MHNHMLACPKICEADVWAVCQAHRLCPLKSALRLCIDDTEPKQPTGVNVWFGVMLCPGSIMKVSHCLGLLLNTEAPVMTPNSRTFFPFRLTVHDSGHGSADADWRTETKKKHQEVASAGIQLPLRPCHPRAHPPHTAPWGSQEPSARP